MKTTGFLCNLEFFHQLIFTASSNKIIKNSCNYFQQIFSSCSNNFEGNNFVCFPCMWPINYAWCLWLWYYQENFKLTPNIFWSQFGPNCHFEEDFLETKCFSLQNFSKFNRICTSPFFKEIWSHKLFTAAISNQIIWQEPSFDLRLTSLTLRIICTSF